MSRPYLLLALLLLAPAARAFDTVDTLTYPSYGRFPAYPPEEIRPYELFVEAGAMYDSNLLRRDANPENENIFRFGGGARLEQRVAGRQGIRLEARGDVYLFDKFSDLNHFAYSGGATWLWELGNDLAGTIGYVRSHRLAAMSETQRAVKRMVTTDDIFGGGAWRVGPSFRLRGLLQYGRGLRDTPGEEKITLATRSATVGADWVTTLGNALGIEHRQSRGDAPVSTTLDPTGTFAGNDYREHETSLVGVYTSSALLRFTGRYGRLNRTYTDLPNNFSGNTYRAGLEWLPGTKTIIGVEAYREVRAIIDIAASHVVTRGFAFGPAWAPTSKIVVSLRAVNERRQFISADPNVAPVGTLLDETLRVARFGIGWEPVRLTQVGLGLDRGNRESNTLGRNYNYTQAMANIRITW